MAIKGKRRTRSRSGRRVAAPPRPFLVPPKKPLFARRPVQVVGILLVLGGFAGVGAGLRNSQDAREHREEVTEFGSQVEATLNGRGLIQPLLATPVVLPNLSTSLQQLRKEKGDHGAIDKDASSWQEATREASDELSSMTTDNGELRQARGLLQHSLELYSGIAGDLQLALDLGDQPRQEMVKSLTERAAVAQEIFDFGWGILQEERRRAGITTAPDFQLPGAGEPGLPLPGQ